MDFIFFLFSEWRMESGEKCSCVHNIDEDGEMNEKKENEISFDRVHAPFPFWWIYTLDGDRIDFYRSSALREQWDESDTFRSMKQQSIN